MVKQESTSAISVILPIAQKLESEIALMARMRKSSSSTIIIRRKIWLSKTSSIALELPVRNSSSLSIDVIDLRDIIGAVEKVESLVRRKK